MTVSSLFLPDPGGAHHPGSGLLPVIRLFHQPDNCCSCRAGVAAPTEKYTFWVLAGTMRPRGACHQQETDTPANRNQDKHRKAKINRKLWRPTYEQLPFCTLSWNYHRISSVVHLIFTLLQTVVWSPPTSAKNISAFSSYKLHFYVSFYA